MGLFEKQVKVFSARGDKAGWLRAKEALAAAGIKPAQAGSYDPAPAAGCGSHLDPRDFGEKGKGDRDEYYIFVKASVADRAKAVLEELAASDGKK